MGLRVCACVHVCCVLVCFFVLMRLCIYVFRVTVCYYCVNSFVCVGRFVGLRVCISCVSRFVALRVRVCLYVLMLFVTCGFVHMIIMFVWLWRGVFVFDVEYYCFFIIIIVGPPNHPDPV